MIEHNFQKKLLQIITVVMIFFATPQIVLGNVGKNVASQKSKKILLIIPFAPGGVADQVWRTLQPGLESKLSLQSITLVSEYRPGVGGGLGVDFASRSEQPTVVLTSSSMVIAPHVNTSLRYRPQDFHVLTNIGSWPVALLVNPKNFSSFADLKEKCLSRGITIGDGGVGSMTHLAASVFAKEINCKVVHVHYRSGPLSLPDLMGEHIDASMVHPSEVALSMIKNNSLKLILLSGNKRLNVVVDSPLASDMGINLPFMNWLIIATNNKVDLHTRKIIASAVQDLLKNKDILEQLKSMGLAQINPPFSNTWLNQEWLYYQILLEKTK
jgi:tripartite-type tricarboxylate transporter receptor subunit TctC